MNETERRYEMVRRVGAVLGRPVTQVDALAFECDLAKWSGDPRRCRWDDLPLVHPQRSWCRSECDLDFAANHRREYAVRVALRRDGGCVRCRVEGIPISAREAHPYRRLGGNLEVNHVLPLLGERATFDCRNHGSNLEVLCRFHHVQVTIEQRKAREKVR